MMRFRAALALLLSALLVVTLGTALGGSVVASASATGTVPAARSVEGGTARVVVPKLTRREKRLVKAQRCARAQWRRTPVRCQRIKAAKAKAARIEKIRKQQSRPPTRPVEVPTPTPAPPSDEASVFTMAVIPDTQQEVFGNDARMAQRSQWLVDRQDELDLRFVNHVGDVVNWGWLDANQYRLASLGMRPLEQAGIPYSMSIGNHDTRAVGWNGQGGYGGGAYVSNPECVQRLSPAQCKTGLLVRGTQEFNDVFTAQRYGAVAGSFEPGKVDNTYSIFAASGYRWLVLNLELWPRTEAVEWAKRVVAAHPRHNVIVSTHHYLDGNSSISSSAGYGTNSPRYLWDNLISQYPNIRMVLSGHVGSASVRLDTGRHGNPVVSLLQTFHSNQGNPVRLVRIDGQGGSIETWVTSPNGRGGDFDGYRRTITGLQFVD